MPFTAYAGLLLIATNVIVSYKGFKSQLFFDQYCFQVDKILIEKDYKRLITSGFLHNSWLHLIINMYSLFIFSGVMESALGSLAFLIIYFASTIGGDLLSVYIHRFNSSYQSVGASAAVFGVMFGAIILFPGLQLGFFPLPFSIYGWLFGLGYLFYTIYGIGSKRGNVAHEAHLGGALIGMLAVMLLEPSIVAKNYFVILVLTIPCLVFLYFIITRPHLLFKENMFSRKQPQKLTVDQQYNARKHEEAKDIDSILEKIHRRGMSSLSRTEKERLEKFSKQ